MITQGLVGTSLADWALPLALTAAVILVIQFLAFGAAAREADASPLQPEALQPLAASSPGAAEQAAPPLSGVPPQLSGAGPARPAVRRVAGGAAAAINDLAGYAGLLQRVFLALLMLWTLLVALGIRST